MKAIGHEPFVTDPETGLTHQQVAARHTVGLDNRIRKQQDQSVWQLILGTVMTFFNLVFGVLAVLLLLAGSSVIKMGFLVVVIINITIGCVQKIRAKQAVDKLTLVSQQQVIAIRDGARQIVPSPELVLDDLVEFAPGDSICADGTVRTGQLWVNEALISGESTAVEKNPGDALLSGSVLLAGRGRIQLTAVGDNAYAPRLTRAAKKNPSVAKPEMLRALDRLIRMMSFILLPVGAILFCHEFFRLGFVYRISMESTVAALVGMIPEGLYLLTSVALAVSALKLSQSQVLVRDMNCIETLARVDVLCLDKTGTITQPEMTVSQLIPLTDTPPVSPSAILSAMYANTQPENDTAQALGSFFREETDLVCTGQLPFTPESKWRGCEFGELGAFLVGAPSNILGSRYADLAPTVQTHTAAGYRVLLLAGCPQLPSGQPENVTPLALILLTHQLRPGAKETFSYFAKQGVQVKVISGDDPQTAALAARDAGIQNTDRWLDTTGLQTQEDFLSAAREYTVFGRVTPEQKRGLLRAFKSLGHTVAMVGDGVNDLLAMKEADCSIAVAGGASAATQLARLVLLDGDFSAMPAIVDEGRRVIRNIRRTAALFLVKNIFSLGLSLLTVLTGLAYPLEPQHMSLLSGLTIGFPAFFLALEPNYAPVTGKFLPRVFRNALPGGVCALLGTLVTLPILTALDLSRLEIATVITGLLAINGMTVLYLLCRPWNQNRRLLWGLLTAALVVSFTLLGGIFSLSPTTLPVLISLGILLVAMPGLNILANRLADRFLPDEL